MKRWNNKIVCLAAMLLAVGFRAEAQQPSKTPRIGFLSVGTATSLSGRLDAFRLGLREHGYVEGQNILVEYRYGNDKIDRVRELAAELVQLRVDVIVTGGPLATRPAKDATATIPIVMAYESDPVGSGYATNLARPGGNVTGLTNISRDLIGKRLELLKETIPKVSRVAVIRNPSMPGVSETSKDAATLAKSLSLSLQWLEIHGPDDLASIFEAATKIRAGALMTGGDAITFLHRKRVSDLAVKHRLATIHGQKQFAEAGALIVYGPNDAEMYRRVATFVDRILKGAKPAELPIEQPLKFDLIINLKTAKQIGLTIPPNVLARAQRVIK